jgi:hypothetical protein
MLHHNAENHRRMTQVASICGIQKDDGKAEVPSGNHNTGPRNWLDD